MAADAVDVEEASSIEDGRLTQQTAEMQDWLAHLRSWVESQRFATRSLISAFRAGRDVGGEPTDEG